MLKAISAYTSYLPKRVLTVIAGLLIVTAVAAGALAGFGPDRATKVYNGPSTPGFDYVTFNSFTNVPTYGDERAFYNAQYADQNQSVYDPLTQIRDGDVITAHIIVHNGADPKHNADGSGIAKNTTVKVNLPAGIEKSHTSTAYVSADNAQPQTVFDTLDFKAENGGFFELDYVEGSAKVIGKNETKALADTLVTSGVNLGDIKGCFEYSVAVTFQVKVKMPSYSIKKSVRFEGQTKDDWKESINAKQGDVVEWRIEFRNEGTTVLENVAIYDQLPENMKIVSGSTKLINTAHPSGISAGSDAVVSNSLDIGDYAPKSNGIVAFKATVDPDKKIECGTKKLLNLAYATPSGFGAVNDGAEVVVDAGVCEEPEQPTFECTALTAEKIGDFKYRFTTKTKVTGDAKVSTYGYNFGDSTNPLITDKAVVEHQYAKAGNYNVDVNVKFTVDGKTKEDSCATKVSITDKPETPEVLPNTGIASALGGFFGTSALFMGARSWLTSRSALKKTILRNRG